MFFFIYIYSLQDKLCISPQIVCCDMIPNVGGPKGGQACWQGGTGPPWPLPRTAPASWWFGFHVSNWSSPETKCRLHYLICSWDQSSEVLAVLFACICLCLAEFLLNDHLFVLCLCLSAVEIISIRSWNSMELLRTQRGYIYFSVMYTNHWLQKNYIVIQINLKKNLINK